MTNPQPQRHRTLSEFVMPYLVIVLTLVLIVSFFSIHKQAQDSAAATEDLRLGLIQNCEANGNPLRNALQAQIEADIEESKSFTGKQAAAFFPNVSPEEIEELTKASIARSEALLATIPDVDCEALYPKE